MNQGSNHKSREDITFNLEFFFNLEITFSQRIIDYESYIKFNILLWILYFLSSY